MEKHLVVPDVIDTLPKEVLKVTYNGGTVVSNGNTLTPTQVKDIPSVDWTASPDKYYLLCMTDPDISNPDLKEVNHWLVGNIPGKDVSKGEVLTAYIGSGPPQGSGLHRYVFLVFEQPGKLEFTEPRIPNTTSENRKCFSIRKFAQKYSLGNPLAGNFYLAEWDEYVPILRKQMGIV